MSWSLDNVSNLAWFCSWSNEVVLRLSSKHVVAAAATHGEQQMKLGGQARPRGRKQHALALHRETFLSMGPFPPSKDMRSQNFVKWPLGNWKAWLWNPPDIWTPRSHKRKTNQNNHERVRTCDWMNKQKALFHRRVSPHLYSDLPLVTSGLSHTVTPGKTLCRGFQSWLSVSRV